MKDKAIAYLINIPLSHIGMIEPIRGCTAEILYAETDGVLIKELNSNGYMIPVDNFLKGQELINKIGNARLSFHIKNIWQIIYQKNLD